MLSDGPNSETFVVSDDARQQHQYRTKGYTVSYQEQPHSRALLQRMSFYAEKFAFSHPRFCILQLMHPVKDLTHNWFGTSVRKRGV